MFYHLLYTPLHIFHILYLYLQNTRKVFETLQFRSNILAIQLIESLKARNRRKRKGGCKRCGNPVGSSPGTFRIRIDVFDQLIDQCEQDEQKRKETGKRASWRYYGPRGNGAPARVAPRRFPAACRATPRRVAARRGKAFNATARKIELLVTRARAQFTKTSR